MKILVTIPADEAFRAGMMRLASDCDVNYVSKSEVTAESVASADIILGNVEPEMIAESPRLKWIQLNTAGADNFTVPGVLAPGTLLTNASGAYGLNISEHMIGMLLMQIKHFDKYYPAQQEHEWTDFGTVRSIWNSRTLIVGLGDIGGQFAQKMHALGAYTVGIRRRISEKPEYLDELVSMDELDEQLAKADYVACSLPGGAATKHLFDAERLAKMKDGAILINVGRGGLVDSYALADALNSGKLGGACLDVVEPEPLPKEHPLWNAKNLILTPHVSGNYHLPETLNRIRRIALENLERYFAGEELKNKVDFKSGYRDNSSENKAL